MKQNKIERLNGFINRGLQYLFSIIMGRHIIIRRFTQLFAVDVIVKLIGFILLPVYLRLMSQTEYGVFGYFLGIVGTFNSFFNLGLYVSQSKLFFDYKGEERKSFLFTMNVLLYVYILTAFIFIYFFRLDYMLIKILFSHPIQYDSYRASLFIGILMNIMISMLFNFLMTSEKIRIAQVYGLIRIVVENAVILTLLAVLPGDKALIRINTFFIMELILAMGFSFFYFREMRPPFNFKMAGRALKIGLPIAAGGVIGIFYNFSDRFILEKVTHFADMAIYNLGTTIAGLVGMVFSTFHNIWLPLFYKEKDLKTNYRKSNKAVLMLIGALAVLGCGLWIVTFLLLRFSIIKSEYRQVLFLLPILLTGQVVQSVTFLYNNFMTYFEKSYIGTAMGIVASFIMLGFNLLLIPRWKIFGAGFSLVITSAACLTIYFILVKLMVMVRMKKARAVQ